ncbi:hypothetical protein CLOM_g2467 [Closterium sp. NIES-68]|nr:hypothetical protein CLOM_g2467 [Closterium sp. NIES-68]GJP74344.1 hypothetical protein CLOP_g4939 [Closterium sp. NIES-67]
MRGQRTGDSGGYGYSPGRVQVLQHDPYAAAAAAGFGGPGGAGGAGAGGGFGGAGAGGFGAGATLASQYFVAPDPGYGAGAGRRSTLSAAAEGKRLAEQLVASFAMSADPIADAGECLASATLWLQTMKSRMNIPGAAGGGDPSAGAAAAAHAAANNAAMAAYGYGPAGPAGGDPGAGMAYYYQPAAGGYVQVGGMPAFAAMAAAAPAPRPPSVKPIPANISFEDYKDRPSDFLREFGDPAALQSQRGLNHTRPVVGVNGNWECSSCQNVNFPRRHSCHQCGTKRSDEGEEIVRNYVKQLIEEAKKQAGV